jgi:hypothetical protein
MAKTCAATMLPLVGPQLLYLPLYLMEHRVESRFYLRVRELRLGHWRFRPAPLFFSRLSPS